MSFEEKEEVMRQVQQDICHEASVLISGITATDVPQSKCKKAPSS